MSTNGSSNLNYHSINSSDSISGLIGRESQTIYSSQNFLPATGKRNVNSNKVDSIHSNGSFTTRSSISSENNIGFGGIGMNNSGRMNLVSEISNSNIIPDADLISNHSIVQGIFNDTKCYDLMQISSKGTVFETTIPFQLAFFALVEHDTDVAPLWDPERRQFVGLMTVGDYINALRVWRTQRLPTTELTARTISDMLAFSSAMSLHSQQQTNQVVRFRHADFQTIDAEDSVVQLCLLLIRSGIDYVPVLDPDNGNLVSILGYLDIVHLLDQAAAQHPHLFSATLEQLRIGTYTNIMTAPKHAKICEVLDALESQQISSLPIVDDTGKVVDTYHKSDVSFVIKAADPDEVVANLGNFKVEECIALREQLLQSGDVMSSFQGLVVCKLEYPLSQIVRSMMIARSTKAVVVDEAHRCIGIVSVKDVIKYYLTGGER